MRFRPYVSFRCYTGEGNLSADGSYFLTFSKETEGLNQVTGERLPKGGE